MTIGTVSYMSPEQVRGESMDARSDVFSLGAVLFEMATGRQVFGGGTPGLVYDEILNKEPASPTALNPALPNELERIIRKVLEKDLKLRYASASDLKSDLERLRGTARAGPGRWLQIAAGVLVLAVVLLGWLLAGRRSSETPAGEATARSIAVLPFDNLSQDPENEYFSDGLTEDIITQLSKIGDLTVISRSLVMRYKNRERDLREVGKDLGVATILESSVRRAGDQLRINAQLIDAQADKHLWAETYDRGMDDIFAIQSEVAESIAASLKVELSPTERERIEKRPTGNLTAYDYYLKGMELYRRYRSADNESAIELYKRALELDPDYALARAGLADAYYQRWQRFGYSSEAVEFSIEEAQKAIALDPTLPEAYKALGNAYGGRGWAEKAVEAYEKAAELNPSYADAVGNLGYQYLMMGENDKAVPWIQKAIAIDPLTVTHYANLAASYVGLNDDIEAEKWLRQAMELEPDSPDGHLYLCEMYLNQGQYQEALEDARATLSRSPDDAWGLVLAGTAELLLGNLAEAEAHFEKSSTRRPSTSTPGRTWVTCCWKRIARSKRNSYCEMRGKKPEERWTRGASRPGTATFWLR